MKHRKNLPAAALTLLLIACVAGYFWTESNPPPRRDSASIVDQRLLRTANQLALLAETNSEQDQAREALRLANNEVDLTFSTELRDAEDAAPTGSATAAQRELADRIAQLTAKVASDQAQVADLTKKGPTAEDQLEIAKAQLELDQDDLGDAQQDLARAGGDLHARLQAARQQYDAAKQSAAPLPKPGPPPAAGTLKDQWQQWSTLGDKGSALASAEEQATAQAADLAKTHNGMEAQATAAAGAANASLADMRKLSSQKKTLMEMDERIQACQQLAATYRNWSALVETRQRAMLHRILRSLAVMLAILLALVLAHRFAVHLIRGQDRRQRHLLEVAIAIACQLVGVIAILLMVFGAPTQLSTMLGLATAGLTVVLKDFIVGFIGWFVLMGRNGVRVGDWVEINGVSGEVIDIGVLKTTVLEMGSTTTGHPTGRRVSFSNSYAIEGHYFNFSTVGQWLWDELQIPLPMQGDPYQAAEQIRQIVEQETKNDSVEAEHDWERVTSEYGVTSFSAKPAIHLRPSAAGLDAVVRYITRAPLRYEVKSRLFQAIVALLQGRPRS